MSWRGFAVVVLGVSLASLAVALGDHEPPRDRKSHNAFVESLRADYPVIALVPLRLPNVPQRDAATAGFHELLIRKLERFDYTVIPPDVYGALWRAELEAIGGIYDPITGRRDDDKYESARARVRQAIAASHGANAFLDAEVVDREITHKHGKAQFGGIKSDPYVKGGATLFGTTLNVGVVTALALHVVLQSADGELLYENYGGIQLLTRDAKSGSVPAYPSEELLQNRDFNKMAVHLALRNILYDARTLRADIRAKNAKRKRKAD